MRNRWAHISSFFALHRFSVTRKITVAYLLILAFSLTSILYALTEMRSQTRHSNLLVERDFKALNLSRDLRANLVAQEGLEQQYLILQDEDLLFLLERRRQEFQELWEDFRKLPLKQETRELLPLVKSYGETELQGSTLLEQGRDQAESFARQTLSPLRTSIIAQFETFSSRRSQAIDSSLLELAGNSSRAYRVTWILLVIGILLSTPVGLSVIFGIHRSITRLTRATQNIAEGQFEVPLSGYQDDEFRRLALEIREMAEKLQELGQTHLDANPLTHLPGNRAIERDLTRRMADGEDFAHLYIDLDNFKAYNDRYGYRRASDAIVRVADLIRQAAGEQGSPEDLVGHIGGDDYVITTDMERAEPLAQRIIDLFEEEVPSFYTAEDREAGSYTAHDRFGVLRQFPLMSISIAIVCSDNITENSPQAIGRECAKMKDHIKPKPGSNYLIDRRKR